MSVTSYTPHPNLCLRAIRSQFVPPDPPGRISQGVCASHRHLIGAYISQDVHLAGAHLTGTISQAVSHRQYPHRRVSHKRAP
jgi:hypothetical protein